MQNKKFESCYLAPDDEQEYDKLLINDQGQKGIYTNVNRANSFKDEYEYRDYPSWLLNYPGGDRYTQKVILKKNKMTQLANKDDYWADGDYDMWLGNYPGGDHLTQKIKIDGKVGRQELYWGEEMYPYLMWLTDKKTGKKTGQKIESYSGLTYDNQRGIKSEYESVKPGCLNDYPEAKKKINQMDKNGKKYYDEYGVYTDLSDFDETYDSVYDLQ